LKLFRLLYKKRKEIRDQHSIHNCYSTKTEKIESAIKYVQSRDTGNIVHTRHTTKTKQTNRQTDNKAKTKNAHITENYKDNQHRLPPKIRE